MENCLCCVHDPAENLVLSEKGGAGLDHIAQGIDLGRVFVQILQESTYKLSYHRRNAPYRRDLTSRFSLFFYNRHQIAGTWHWDPAGSLGFDKAVDIKVPGSDATQENETLLVWHAG